MSRATPIAIVGIGCRFPGDANDVDSYWRLLLEGRDAIADIPPDRWDAKALYDADHKAPGKTYVTRGGFLRNIGDFDPEFFGISPREAAHIDPQQRLLLETAYEAMEDAGETPAALARIRTGVFIGLFIHDYQHIQLGERDQLGAYTGTGTAMSIAANRLSYLFDLKGPSVAVDTACSSSLVAVHLACQSLISGESDCALAGGVNVILKPEMTIAMSKASMLSPDGRCKAFDSRANGYVRSEGAGVVVLKTLSAALADGNPIYAVIRGSAVNQDGKTVGISVPSGVAQAALIREACQKAGVSPGAIQYVEAHGTGTPVGDPIEANALGSVLAQDRPAGTACLLGSVKTNIGHLESASGVAGLIKAALCLERGVIPKSLHFENANPKIDLPKLQLKIATQPEPWPEASGPRLASVNSFGFGGTNAHVILEAPPERTSSAPVNQEVVGAEGLRVLRLSAHSADALSATAQNLIRQLSTEACSLDDLCYTLNRRRPEHAFRVAVSGSNREQLTEALQPYASQNRQVSAVTQGPQGQQGSQGQQPGPLFIYTGMGPQWWGMGRELMQREPVFREAIENCDRAFTACAGWSLLAELLADEQRSRIHETQVAQPAIFAIQVGLTHLWRSWGMVPSAVIGHSIGEIAAAHAAGILSLEDAVALTYHRSRLQSTTAGSGSMLAVGLGEAEARRLIEGNEHRVSIAVINSPMGVTLSGDSTCLAELRAELERKEIFARPLAVEVPYHSVMMEPLRADFFAALSGMKPREANVSFHSTLLGRQMNGTEMGVDYWWRNLREAVLFGPTLQEWIRSQPGDVPLAFLEVGPHPVLTTSIRECLQACGREATLAPSLRRSFPEQKTLFDSLGTLYAAGLPVDWASLTSEGEVARLPAYPWQRVRCWAESAEAEQSRKGVKGLSLVSTQETRHPLLGSRLGLSRAVWDQAVDVASHGYLRDHRVQGEIVFPGAGYLEMALSSLGADFEKEDCVVENVELIRALFVPETGAAVHLQLAHTEGGGFEVHSRLKNEESWTRNCAGRIRRDSKASTNSVDLALMRERISGQMPVEYAYSLFKDVGLHYGPYFQGIVELRVGRNESLARIELPGDLSLEGYLFHPAILDACLHSLFGALALNGEDSARRGSAYLPVRLGRLRVHHQPQGALWCHAKITKKSDFSFTADVDVYDADGRKVAEVGELRCQAIDPGKDSRELRSQSWLYDYRWEPAELAAIPASPGEGQWLLFTNNDELPAQFLKRGHRVIRVGTAETFRSMGDGSLTADIGSADDLRALFDSAEVKQRPLLGVVHAYSLETALETSRSGELTDATLRSAQRLGYGSVLMLAQKLVELQSDLKAELQPELQPNLSPRLWLLTSGCEAVAESDREIQVAHTSLLGLHRVLGNEHPALRSTIIDLSADPSSDELESATGEILSGSPEDELAIRGRERFVHRLHRVTLAADRSVDAIPNRSECYALEIGTPGQLDTLHFHTCAPDYLEPRDVEIRVQAAALNFKDVLKATGLFPHDLMEGNLWSRSFLGMECAGVVERVGTDVTNLVPGQRVMALAPRSFRSHAVTVCDLVAPIPADLGVTDAASIPMVYLTAHYGLITLARLKRGERVLIHAAAGGVGQAAIQIARSVGAEVFATAGSEAKRELLRRQGVEHVFDSRSLHFGDEIARITERQGVDVVLNSLPGLVIEKSLSLLRDYGRFVEIGKMDINRDLRIGLKPFDRNLSFFAVDLDRMLAQDPELCGQMLCRVAAQIAAGQLKPVPNVTFPVSKAADAFREMATAKHIGKVVLDFAQRPEQVSGKQGGIHFEPDASYLITGGLGGFGSSLAHWMVERGARNIVLIGRKGADSSDAAAIVAKLQERGARVRVLKADVARLEDVQRVLGEIEQDPPLRGIFHAAGLLDDALVVQQDFHRFEKVSGPKVYGTWNLHQATLGLDLDYFVLFSSVATTLGNQGSANYAAANAFMDGIARYRRRMNKRALSINWGVIADVGMAADEDFYRRSLETNGLTALFSRHGLDQMEALLVEGATEGTISPIDWQRWLRFNPAGATTRYAIVAKAPSASVQTRTQMSQEIALRKKVLEAPEGEREALVKDEVRAVVAKLFGFAPGKIDSRRTLTDIGMDSLMAVEMKAALDRIGVAVPVATLLRDMNVDKLTDEVLKAFGAKAGEAVPAVETPKTANPWLHIHEPRPEATMRLFCFSYAGGGPAVFQKWPEHLPADMEICAVHLPGRGSRLEEKALTDLHEIATRVAAAIIPMLDKPFAFLGHCMGAIVMYEVACLLREQHGVLPVHLFVSGSMAPQLYNSPLVHEQPDPKFMQVLNLISFTTTRALVEDAELRGFMFPMLRADFQAVATYGVARQQHAPLDVPITGFAALQDLFAAPVAMRGWAKLSTRPMELAMLEGDHYFIEAQRPLLSSIVVSRLGRGADGGTERGAERSEPTGIQWQTIAAEDAGAKPLSAHDGPAPAAFGQGVEKNLFSVKRAGVAKLRVVYFPGAWELEEVPRFLRDVDLGPGIEVLSAQIPGRGCRIHESASSGLDEIIDELVSGLRALADQPMLFVGHCMGALIGYEVARRLKVMGIDQPRQCLFSGAVAPHIYTAPNAHLVPEEKLLDLFDVIGHPSAEALRTDSALRKQMIPLIRADLAAMAGYRFVPGPKLDCPITVLIAQNDLWAYPLQAGSWREHTTSPHAEVKSNPGDHFFPHKNPEVVIGALRIVIGRP